MALPGLSFHVEKARGPFLGPRADRTSLIAMCERGPIEEPTEVRSIDEFHRVFGCPVPGMLGSPSASAYFENGGEILVVVRLLLRDARASSGSLPTLRLSAGPTALPILLADAGAFGDRIEVFARAVPLAVIRAEVLPAAPGVSPAVSGLPAAEGPMRLFVGALAHWAICRAGALTPPLPPGTSAGPITAELYGPTFALTMREIGRPDITVHHLDLRDVAAMRERLELSPLRLDATAIDAPDFDLPVLGHSLRLSGGSDGLAWTAGGEEMAREELADSFRRAIIELERSDFADVVIAPDLWSRVFRTKGIDRVCLDGARAEALADELVSHAARTHERVAILDAPLRGADALEPAATPELEAWRADRTIALASDRDFAALVAPWARVRSDVVYRGDATMIMPPSPFVAGRMARTARERGPWIATGNVAIAGALGASRELDVAERERLQDAGIVPLEARQPEGATIMGVRSLSHPDRPAWRFLSTRRLFNFLRRALVPIGRSYAFEPNTIATWVALRRDLEALLRAMFQKGAFAGATAEEAFFAKVDETLNPESERDRGVLNAHIGVAPAAPLEFLVVHLAVAPHSVSVEDVG